MKLEKSLYIDGKIVKGSHRHQVVNPATEQAVATLHLGGEKETKQALESAQKAFKAWSSTPIVERVGWMNKLRHAIAQHEYELRRCVHLEMGKSWSSTKGDYAMLLDSLDYYADLIQTKGLIDKSQSTASCHHDILRQPIGVAAAFLAWNFPLLNIAYKIGPAMAAGCPIILKPSLKTPLSGCLFGEICASINLPAGVINLVCGDDQIVGDTISSSKIPSLISLIGSSSVAKHVIKTGATSIKRYSMELGGNAPMLVLDDADLDLASDIAANMKTENAGQICVTPNRIFVHKSRHDEFVALLKAKMQSKTVGFDKDAPVDMGPVIDMQAWHRIDSLVKQAVKDGANIETGGGRPAHIDKGAFYAPTLLTNVNENMSIYQQEIFGPVASIIAFDDLDDVLKKANNTDAGLSSFIFGQDTDTLSAIAGRLEFGEVHINGINYAINLPHCGLKQSGTGVDCSEFALDEYYAVKRISTALP